MFLLMLKIFTLFFSTSLCSVQAGEEVIAETASVEVVRGIIDAAVTDKQQGNKEDDKEDLESNEDAGEGDEESSLSGQDKNDLKAGNSMRRICPRSLREIGDGLTYGFTALRKGAAQGFSRAYDFDYRSFAAAQWDGIVQGCWNGLQSLRWYSRVMLPEHHKFERVSVFDNNGSDKDTVECVTTDGYRFVVPMVVCTDKFFNKQIIDSFGQIITRLKHTGVNVSSRVLYLIMRIRALQVATPDVEGAALFNANQAALGRISISFRDYELFDVLRSCRDLCITDEVMLEVINLIISHELASRYPLYKIEAAINRELVLYLQYKKVLKETLKNIVMAMPIFSTEQQSRVSQNITPEALHNVVGETRNGAATLEISEALLGGLTEQPKKARKGRARK